MTKYDDVKVIRTDKAGMVIDVKNGRYLVDLGDAQEWFDECDLLLAAEMDENDEESY